MCFVYARKCGMLTVVNKGCVRSWGKIITVVGREDFSSREEDKGGIVQKLCVQVYKIMCYKLEIYYYVSCKRKC